jgi:hypothetical protein
LRLENRREARIGGKAGRPDDGRAVTLLGLLVERVGELRGRQIAGRLIMTAA